MVEAVAVGRFLVHQPREPCRLERVQGHGVVAPRGPGHHSQIEFLRVFAVNVTFQLLPDGRQQGFEWRVQAGLGRERADTAPGAAVAEVRFERVHRGGSTSDRNG